MLFALQRLPLLRQNYTGSLPLSNEPPTVTKIARWPSLKLIFSGVLLASSLSAGIVAADENDELVIEEAEAAPLVKLPGVDTPADEDASEPDLPTPMPDQSGTEGKTEPPAALNTVKRPTADKYVPQPIDQEIRKNPDGHVSFNIKGQPWEPVLQWLSDASAMSLDWQELPGDSLNLITTREYTMEEARDLINRHLLSRGFTMIVSGEVMSVVKIKDLNPALVQRVKPSELASLPDHTICKVSFDLDWLIAEEAAEELKPMLSSAGRIHKLSRTNRLEVIDTAISLRQLWDLIESEQSTEGQEQLVRAFRLENRRAEDVIRMLRDLLNLQSTGDSTDNPSAMDPNAAMQMMQQMQQMQEMQQADVQADVQTGGGGGAGARPKVETRLVLNQRENMILAQASPDQMAVIEKAIEQIDVPGDHGRSLLQNINRMKVYRLESIEPQTLTDLLQQLGDLDPGTVLKVDRQKRSIIAWATLADHLTITTLVEKLDQSSRKIEVIPLRRLDSEYVAGTIRLLMGKEEPKESNPYERFGYFDYGMMPNQQSEKEPSFKVEADTENNRLLVNASTIEMEEIRDLLIKLGEMPDPNAASDGIRVFDLNSDEDLDEFQQQLKRYWRRGNRLEFDLPPPAPRLNPESEMEQNEDQSAAPATTRVPANEELGKPRVNVWQKRTSKKQSAPGDALDQMLAAHRLAQTPVGARHSATTHSTVLTGLPEAPSDEAIGRQAEAVIDPQAADERPAEPLHSAGTNSDAGKNTNADDSDESQPKISPELIEKLRRQLDAPARERSGSGNSRTEADDLSGLLLPETDESFPVKISLTPDGKLIVTSRDPQALEEIESLISQVVSPRRNFKVFRLKYATPSWVTLNLKDFFKAEQEPKSTPEYNPYWGIMPSEKKATGNRTLSRRRNPQFISDNFTSTILVRDADAKQLKTIEELIMLYDVPEPSDSRSMRVTTIFRLENARASSVADAVKDVFRDLLSSNDKALEQDDKGQQRQGSGGLVTFLPSAEKKEGDGEEEPIRFKGLLSIGIDESSNTLIVSSAGTLMDTIGEMIEALDDAADSASVVQVLKVDRSVDLALIQERLKELMKGTQQPPGQQTGQPIPGQPGFPGVVPGPDGVVPDGNE